MCCWHRTRARISNWVHTHFLFLFGFNYLVFWFRLIKLHYIHKNSIKSLFVIVYLLCTILRQMIYISMLVFTITVYLCLYSIGFVIIYPLFVAHVSMYTICSKQFPYFEMEQRLEVSRNFPMGDGSKTGTFDLQLLTERGQRIIPPIYSSLSLSQIYLIGLTFVLFFFWIPKFLILLHFRTNCVKTMMI